MAMSSSLLIFFSLLCFSISSALAANVTYDHRSLIIDGRRRLIISTSIHYPRSVPEMWPRLVAMAKDGGADAIETYVFWNGHEPSPGNYYFEDRFDLVKFVEIVRDAGMYLLLRIGPFVAAEWNFGGVPVWLHYVPGTVFRTDNKNFKFYMEKFLTLIVDMMKQRRFFASQGGPIILSQVENEYGDIETVYGEGGKPYAMWAANMALSKNIGVPWIMCQQYDAPGPVINTCNSFYCDQFTPNSLDKPKMWTENWPGWFKTFGSRNPHRPPEDIAFAVARFFQKGGSLQNYYMYHGGTNFGRTSGGPFITTSYDYDAPIDEYGLARLPKWAHLKELHKSIKLCESTMLFGMSTLLHLGHQQEADVYTDSSGNCVAFLANIDEVNDKLVDFQNRTYHLPAWSVSILPDCKNEAFNTAKIRSQTSIVDMVPENLQATMKSPSKFSGDLQWDIFMEKAGIWEEPDFVKEALVDHINTTKDSTDYLWYTTSLHVDEHEDFLYAGSKARLILESKGHAVHAFINQELQGSASGNGTVSPFKLETPITLKEGKNEIALLSMTVGLQNAGPFFEWVGAGLTSVKISGFRNGTVDLTSAAWSYKVGLEGEHKGVYNIDGSSKVKWISMSEPPRYKPLTWYKTVIDAPKGAEPVGLDMNHMGKGQAWLNGKAIGRYWPRKGPRHGCPASCNYRGKFFPDKCNNGCGEPTQRWYHVPRSWFQPSGNTLVIFEEKGGDPTKIALSRRHVTGVCGLVSENYPSIDLESWDRGVKYEDGTKASIHLKCPESTQISSVRFASFGNPSGICGSYIQGSCHYPHSASVVEKACLNKNECVVSLSEAEFFTTELCDGVTKTLAIEAACD
ncbi:Beta-galactosidase protein [Dioscorea alata]|uniref:Beta-galactosidase protein n=1 Tax=Dioscorea alata TaxID=55571 RepID=A0ACB7WBZ8_DIOAL|nr:Beta-galactosidase protein [Dioscorea alata]